MLKRVVTVVEAIAVAGFVVFVALLLLKQPQSVSATTYPRVALTGDAVFDSQCARCHGTKGEGEIGPKLNGGAVTEAFPTADAEVALVTNGLGGMPAFGHQLSAQQIRAVVDFTRTGLQQR
jgi:mono/diheme cytochrome c family protein